MNTSSCASSNNDIERNLMSKEYSELRTFLTCSRTSSTDVLIQTESSTMMMQQTVWYLISFSASDISDTSYFNESDVTRFLNCFKLLDENHEVKNVTLIQKLSKYCESEIQKEVKTQENYVVNDWEQFWQQLQKWYYQYDIYQQMYLKSFLEIYKNQKCIMNDDIEFYCSTFKLILINLETQ